MHLSFPTSRSRSRTTAPLPLGLGRTIAGRRANSLSRVVALLAIALFMAACSGGGLSDLPAARGSIVFGDTFDTHTFAISGQRTTFSSGSSVGMVAVLSRTITEQAAVWETGPDGSSINVSTIPASGGNDVWGLVVPPIYFPAPGLYSFAVKDIGGNTLATGSVTIT